MSVGKNWHEDDAFWATIAPVDFDEERWSRAPKEVDQVLSLIKISPGATVLDLCCGLGRHSLELARHGYRVVGVDRTASFLEEAKGKAKAAGLAIEFVSGDMRSFCRPGSFDAVINLFTSIGYFANPDDDRNSFANAFQSLKSGGALVIDTLAKEVVARNFRERDWQKMKSGVVLLEERKILNNWEAIQSDWIILIGNERKELHFSIRLYSAAELSAMLKGIGFKQVEIYGDLAGAAFDHAAKRLVAVARK